MIAHDLFPTLVAEFMYPDHDKFKPVFYEHIFKYMTPEGYSNEFTAHVNIHHEENFAPYSNPIFEADDDYDDDDDYIERHEDDWDDDFSDWDGGEPDAGDDDSDLEDDDDQEYEHDHSEEVDEPEDEDYKDELEEVQYLSESEVKKKKPRLGKVTRNPAGSNKKFHVYVKCNGRVKKISFGDPGLSIKRDSAARRKNFRARHKCDKPAGKNRCTARYWSCYQWRAGKKVEGE